MVAWEETQCSTNANIAVKELISIVIAAKYGADTGREK